MADREKQVREDRRGPERAEKARRHPPGQTEHDPEREERRC
jgi:hypothetical protein